MGCVGACVWVLVWVLVSGWLCGGGGCGCRCIGVSYIAGKQ